MKLFSIINFIIFQSCWALAATFPANAPFFMLLGFLIHFALSPSRQADCLLIMASLIGIFADQTLVSLGVLNVNQAWLPLWLIMLWAHFTLCLNHSLRWLQKLNYPIQSLFGAVFGSLSYWTGLQVEVFNTFAPTAIFVLIYAMVWAILLPLFVMLAQQTQRIQCH